MRPKPPPSTTTSDAASIIDPKNPALPNIPTKSSFAYGSQVAAILPRQLVVQDSMDLSVMAETIDKGRRQAEVRQEEEAQENEEAALRQRSPVRRPRGETPDQTQLFGALQEDVPSVASSSPRQERSTPTPSPPVMRMLSSSPRRGNGIHLSFPASSPYDSEEESTFSLERNIHDDDLRRTHPGRHGTNISAPPRRISGIHHSTIEEDDDFSAPMVQAQQPARPEPKQVAPPTSQAKTPRRRPSQFMPTMRAIRTILLLSLALLSASFAAYAFRDELVNLPRRVYSKIPAGPSWPSSPPSNASDPKMVKALKAQMGEMEAYVSSLHKDLDSVKAKMAHASHNNNVQPISGHKEMMRQKPNFLAPGMGAIVHPKRTTPTEGKRETWLRWMYRWITKQPTRLQPAAALVPWQEVGDCWCTVPLQGGQVKAQLTITLGRAIVPEEIVVEHVPYGSSIKPEVTPRRMELWAHFVGDVPNNPAASRFAWFLGAARRFSSNGKRIPASSSPPPYTYTSSGRFLLHETIMAVLRNVYKNEPEKRYASVLSDDESLGMGYYRLGRFEYDLHGRDYVQSFPLEAIVDLPSIRVDNVILRATSNWGGNATCLYWVKLFGHL